MLRRVFVILCVGIVFVCRVAAQQVTPRIAGLEGNEEYMSLLREDARLLIREDSVVKAVGVIRQRFREDTQNRAQYAKEILALEEQVFGIRSARGRFIDRVVAIEQDWVLSNLDSPQAALQPTSQPAVVAEGGKVRNLIYNSYFKKHLTSEDYAALVQAQHREMEAVDYVNRYMGNYHDLTLLVGMYAVAATETEAVDIYGKYKTLLGVNEALADSLSATWNYIFDNKSFAYAYLLDKLGKEDLLTREEQLLSDAAQQLSKIQGEYVSDVLADYVLRKQVAVDYERRMAELLLLDAARDSLRGVAAQLKELDYRLPKLEIAERYFLDLSPVEFSSTTQYTYANPIPECRIYSRGTIYRILLGTFNTKRAASLFKGAHPLCYHVDGQGKWSYYAGGFATREEAVEAQKQLKSRGFLRPEIVVWRDGHYRNLSRDPEVSALNFRIEIVGVATLPDPVREVIASQASQYELSRVGSQMYVIAPFAEKSLAETLAAAIRNVDSILEIKVAEIVESPK